MTTSLNDPNPRAGTGHHSGDGRNVIPAGRGHEGRDVFFGAVQMTRMPMCLSDPSRPDNPLVFVNRAFCVMTGYEEHEILGRNCRFLQGPDTDPIAVRKVRDAIEAREDVSVELYNYRKDGSGFWNALYLSPVFDDAGRLLYHFASQLDVTRRREAEAVLQQSQRMEALGGLASSMAHEFNNLMTVVIASVEQARGRAGDDERQHRQLDRADLAARRAGRLTQQMLSFARRQFHDDRPADLNALVAGLDQILAQVAGAKAQLRLELAPGPLPVRLDAGQLELSLINLVRNAADAMPSGGRVTVATAARDGGAELRVSDTGEGMTPEVARRATEPFFTTRERGRGTGLGLSMVYGFTEQSGGRFAIESAPGKGTTVRLAFPGHDGGSDATPWAEA